MRQREKEKIIYELLPELKVKARYFKKVFNLDIELEDLEQELVLKTLEALDKWNKKMAIKGYINRICLNYVLDCLKKKKLEIDNNIDITEL